MGDRLTDLIRAEADSLDIPRPPTEAILRDGQDAKRRGLHPFPIRRRGMGERRLAGVVVLGGVAASIVAVAGIGLSLPDTGPTADDAVPATITNQPDADGPACLRGVVEHDEAGEPQCVPWPGTGGLRAALEGELLSADPAQRRAIEDNRVTQAEYRAGFERYRGCLSAKGYQLESVEQRGPVLDFGVPSEAVSSGDDDICYLRHFKAVDMAWQMTHADETLRETTLRMLNACVQDNGIGPAADMEQAEALMRDAGLTEEDCGLTPGQLDAVQR